MNLRPGFPITERWITEQLSDTAEFRSLFQKAAEIYASMQLSLETSGARDSASVQSAGKFGGTIKTWKAGLIAVITQDIINILEMDVSRERVRALQYDIFGRAQASKDLNNYAIRIRNGGGRAAPMPEIPASLKNAAFKMFIDHENDLKDAVIASARPTN